MSRAVSAAVPVVVVALLVALPFAANNYILFIANLILVYAVAALGFDILVGWSGQIGLAHAALFGVGAYGSAILTGAGVPFLVTIPLVGVAAGVVALLIGFPAIRLSGFFLAIATLAFGLVIVEAFIAGGPVTGGGAGLAVPAWQLPPLTTPASLYFLTVLVVVVVYGCAWRALRGRFGRTLQAVRDLGPVVGSLGIPAVRYRLTAFVVSGFVAAVAGALYGQLQTFVFPTMFDMNLLVPMLVMVFLGGAGTMWGPCVGAVVTVLLVELFQDFGALQSLAYGVALMVAIGFLRGGLVSLVAEVRRARWTGRLLGRRPAPGREITERSA
ncbi:branched-chain amino acid ABC transporter permease [Pseudonocardia parietis]|uniref:Branched-chain amino acid transport system permease protein n=1 Tax=Pseudonocardia parietis TaxID=570936 RepID=A0ABS4W0C3_9PSEU|nr:branched-chain amino acid ABC transporter permease [Pseudonocardia parietis]MBP2369398.1 branched-chain amino acid transport system permease protein [Pseudonocardia parietis]